MVEGSPHRGGSKYPFGMSSVVMANSTVVTEKIMEERGKKLTLSNTFPHPADAEHCDEQGELR